MSNVRQQMEHLNIDVLLLGSGPDLPYLTGYEAMPLERLTMLVVPVDAAAKLVVPELEAARVADQGDLFEVVTWSETADPIAMVASMAGDAPKASLGDRTWARFALALQEAMPHTTWSLASEVVGPLRAVKDAAEIEMLRRAGAAVDRIAARLQAGEIELVGRTEAEVSADLGDQIRAEGHRRVNFAIVAAGPNAASPHHEPGDTVIRAGDVVLCDFGGTMLGADGVGYCSDITRCVSLGEPHADVRRAYDVLESAQAAAVATAQVGVACEDVDAAARAPITDAGFGPQFMHRTGHGIGVEEHEDPYIVAGNATPLVAGHAFSIEPGIYVDGHFGLRLEDIVVATAGGPDPMNRAAHGLAVL